MPSTTRLRPNRFWRTGLALALFATSCASSVTLDAGLSPTDPAASSASPARDPRPDDVLTAAPEPAPSPAPIPTSPSEPSRPEPTNEADGDPLASVSDLVDGVERTNFEEHEGACDDSSQQLRWVGNTIAVTDVSVIGEPWASQLAADTPQETFGGNDENWALCVVLLPAPTELRACADDRAAGGAGPFAVEGVRVIAMLDDVAGGRVANSSTVLFGRCPYVREAGEVRELTGEIEAGNGQVPSRLGYTHFEGYVGELLDFAVAIDERPILNEQQCNGVAAALITRADYVAATNEAFGMANFGRLGPDARVPSVDQVRGLHTRLATAVRVGVHARSQLFDPQKRLLRSFARAGDAVRTVGSVFGTDGLDEVSPHDASAFLAERKGWLIRVDSSELLRWGVELLDLGCNLDSITAATLAAVPGMAPFDPSTSDPTLHCGWLQAMYGYRLEIRRALGRQDFETADELNTRLYGISSDADDMAWLEPFLDDVDRFALTGAELTMFDLADPSRDRPDNLVDGLPRTQAAVDRTDNFARTRCGDIPAFLIDVPTMAEVLVGGSPSPDDLGPMPVPDGYRNACEEWLDFADARAALWAALPTELTSAPPSVELIALRRDLDRLWLPKQVTMATRPGFVRQLDAWNTMTNADRSLWMAATEASTAEIDADDLRAAEHAVAEAVQQGCAGTPDIDRDLLAAALPALADA